MLDVSVDANDGFPEHVCEKCKRRLERLEKAVEDLESLELRMLPYVSRGVSSKEVRTPVL